MGKQLRSQRKCLPQNGKKHKLSGCGTVSGLLSGYAVSIKAAASKLDFCQNEYRNLLEYTGKQSVGGKKPDLRIHLSGRMEKRDVWN